MSSPGRIAMRAPRPRRGSVYLIVLATTTVIATMIAGTVYVQTARLKSERVIANAAKARLAAESGIEVVRAWIKQDPAWRTTRTSGRWASNLVLGEANVDLDVVDPVDGNLANHPYHGVQITSTARVGEAEQIMTATLVAKPYPVDALKYAVHTDGMLHVNPGARLEIGASTASANGELDNDSVIEGDVITKKIDTRGTVFGTIQTGIADRDVPDSSNMAQVIALGTTITTNTLTGVTLSPTSNPYGAPNPYGIYVVNGNDNVTITNCQVTGTLVVQAPGKITTFAGSLSITPASADFPALLVNGDLAIQATSGRISGLVHATKTVTLSQTMPIVGTVIATSKDKNNAVSIFDERVLQYDSSLFDRPPVGYAKTVDMVLQPGSYRRVVR